MYDVLKAVHLIAVVTAISGMVAVALGLGLRTGQAPAIEVRLRPLHVWDRAVTGPALAIALIAGFTLAADAGFLSSGWLLLKLCLVAALSGLHLLQGSALARLCERDGGPVPSMSGRPWLVLTLAAPIILLAVIKPSVS